MARTRNPENQIDPATGRPLPAGVAYRGPAQYRVRKMVNGKRLTETFDTAKLAAARLQAVEVDLQRSEFVDRSILDKITVTEMVERFIAEKMQIGGARRGAAEDMGHTPSILNDDIGSMKLSELNSARVQAFRNRQQREYAPATVVKRLNLLAAIINHARSEWHYPLGENPASSDLVERPAGADVKRDRRLMAPKAHDVRQALAAGGSEPKHEEDRLFEALRKSQNPWDIWLARWAIASAMRQSEIFALEWGDIDIDARVVEVHGRARRGTKAQAKPIRSGKRKKQAHESHGVEKRPLMPDAVKILREHPHYDTAKSSDKVFPAGDQKNFSVRFRRLVERAKIVDLTFHDLRHEATSRLAKIYKSPMDLMRVTGHRELKSLNRYYQPDMSELADLAEKAVLATQAERAR